MEQKKRDKLFQELYKLTLKTKVVELIDGLYFTFNEEENIGIKRAFNELLQDLKDKLKKEIKKL